MVDYFPKFNNIFEQSFVSNRLGVVHKLRLRDEVSGRQVVQKCPLCHTIENVNAGGNVVKKAKILSTQFVYSPLSKGLCKHIGFFLTYIFWYKGDICGNYLTAMCTKGLHWPVSLTFIGLLMLFSLSRLGCYMCWLGCAMAAVQF